MILVQNPSFALKNPFPRFDPIRDQKSCWITFEKLGPGDQTSRHTSPDHLGQFLKSNQWNFGSQIGSNLGN